MVIEGLHYSPKCFCKNCKEIERRNNISNYMTSLQKESEEEEKDTSWEEKIVENLIEEISKNHAKILDDFTKAYISSRWGDYFSKQKKIDFRRIELCHQVKSPTENVYWFRMKRGKLPSNLIK